ncbi:MAG: hypothetical protein ACK56F_28770, partial [bacterium]
EVHDSTQACGGYGSNFSEESNIKDPKVVKTSIGGPFNFGATTKRQITKKSNLIQAPKHSKKYFELKVSS